MTVRFRRELRTAVVLLAGIVFIAGSGWGLPSTWSDRFLFNGRIPWTGAEIVARAGAWDESPQRGADVASRPASGSDETILNDTDEQRARIIRRYRLFSNQPDEWVTFASLARMHPGKLDLDPRVYQYGGVWIYPVGMLLRAAGAVGLAKLHPDLAWYLDHPADFGRFYVIARLYSAAWGIVGAWLIFELLRRIGAGDVTAALGAIVFVMMPAVVNMAHEAKPHLAVTVATLAVVMCAARWLAGDGKRWWWGAAVACGIACGLAPTGAASTGAIAFMAWRRGGRWRGRLLIFLQSMAVALLVFAVTNPFVPIHLAAGLIHHSQADSLKSNLLNTAAMYSLSSPGRGLFNAALLTAEGAGAPLALIGFFGGIFLPLRGRLMRSRRPAPRRAAEPAMCDPNPLWLMLAPAAITGIVFAAFGAEKPGEYGRFFLDVDVMLLMMAIAAAVRLAPRGAFAPVAAGILLLLTGINGALYLVGFIQDSSTFNTRAVAAALIQRWEEAGAITVLLKSDPAPYCTPPMDLFNLRWRLPRAANAKGPGSAPPDLIVQAVDTLHPPQDLDDLPGYAWVPIHGSLQRQVQTPISWASKPFDILVRQSFVQRDDPVAALGPTPPRDAPDVDQSPDIILPPSVQPEPSTGRDIPVVRPSSDPSN